MSKGLIFSKALLILVNIEFNRLHNLVLFLA